MPTLATQEEVNSVPLKLDLPSMHNRLDGQMPSRPQTTLLDCQKGICLFLRKWQKKKKVNSISLKNISEAARSLPFSWQERSTRETALLHGIPPPASSKGKVAPSSRRVGNICSNHDKPITQEPARLPSMPGNVWIPERRFKFVLTESVHMYIHTGLQVVTQFSFS